MVTAALMAAGFCSSPAAAQTMSSDATLSELSVGSRVVFGIDQDQTVYHVGVAPDVGEATVTAVATDPGASVSITSPADADMNTAGHQVALSAGANSVTVEVTAEDGSTKTYTVSVNRGGDRRHGMAGRGRPGRAHRRRKQ